MADENQNQQGETQTGESPKEQSLAQRIPALVRSVVQALVAAIQTQRFDRDKQAEVEANYQKQIAELNEALGKARTEDAAEDAALESLGPEMEEALRIAQAARPPSPDQIAEVKNPGSQVDPVKVAAEKRASEAPAKAPEPTEEQPPTTPPGN